MWRLFYILFYVYFISVVPIELNENAKDAHTKTRMVEYEYYFKSETVVYEANKKNEGIHLIMEAIIEFKLLHYDEDANVLGRYRFKKCIRGPCQQVFEDVLVNFSQSNHHLKDLFIIRNKAYRREGELPEWNLLAGIALTIQNPVRTASSRHHQIRTSFGICDYRSNKADNQVFTETINNCQMILDSNQDLISDITTTYYNQHVVFRKNQQVDADIIYIDATEDFHISSVLHEKWNLNVKSTMFLKLIDRKLPSVKEVCEPNAICGDCAVTTFSGELLGHNWREYLNRFRFKPSYSGKLLKLNKLVEEYRDIRQSSQRAELGRITATAARTRMLNQVINAILRIDVSEIEPIVKHTPNRVILKDLVQAFAAGGDTKVVTALRKVFESPILRPYVFPYVNSLAHTIRPSSSLFDELKAWVLNLRSRSALSQLQESLLASMATLTRRHCQRNQSSVELCNSMKDNKTRWLWTTLVDGCKIDDNFACKLFALNTLINLPIKPVCEYALKYVCVDHTHSRDLQKAALRLLRKCNTSYINSESVQKLINVFSGSCAAPQSLEESALALDVLLESGLMPDLENDEQQIGPRLFHIIANTWHIGRLETEKIAYFYDAIKFLSRSSLRINSGWSELRKQRGFRTNYSQFVLNASTAVQRNILGVLPVNKPVQLGGTMKTLFSRGFPKQIEYSLNYLTASLSADGKYRLLLKDLINFYFTSAFSRPRPDNVIYGFTVLDHSEPIKELQESILFRNPDPDEEEEDENHNDEIRGVQEEVHNIRFRHLDGVIPLLSGFAIKVQLIGSVSFSILHERIENRCTEDHDVQIEASIVLDGNIELLNIDRKMGRMLSEFSADVGISGTLRLQPPMEFSRYTTNLNVSDSNIRQTIKFIIPPSGSATGGELRGIMRQRRINGVCHGLSLHPQQFISL